MLHARGIRKEFGVVTALAGVDIDVDAGEIVALVGENGSGKSTLARILSGALVPTSGEILIDETSQSFTRPRDALQQGIALVAQEPTAVPEISIAENVLIARLPGIFGRVDKRLLRKTASPFLDLVGVECDPLAPLTSLRTGDRELVEVAKALATEPRLLILDEATSRLGGKVVERLFAIVRRLQDQGMATILITHRLPEICELADRAVILRDGSLVGGLDREHIDEERLASMMVGRELSDFFHKRDIEPGGDLLEVGELVADGARTPVSFVVRAGEVVGLAGLVGSGRSELLETIAGVRRARAGGVCVDGRRVRPGSPRESLSAGLALVPEDRHRQGLALDATLRENVSMGGWRVGAPAAKRTETRTARAAVDRLRIRTAGIDVAVRTLSGGNQQKVVLGRCLARNPKVLLLDEPTRGIDVGAKEEIFQLIGELLERGIGILLASSDMMELLALSDRILVMHEQRIVGEFTRAEASEERIALLSAGGGEARPAA